MMHSGDDDDGCIKQVLHDNLDWYIMVSHQKGSQFWCMLGVRTDHVTTKISAPSYHAKTGR